MDRKGKMRPNPETQIRRLRMLQRLCKQLDNASQLQDGLEPAFSVAELNAMYHSDRVRAVLRSSQTQSGRTRRVSQLTWGVASRLMKPAHS
mmetsp:Transcript_12664/g.27632  ORF Transcript_12664/g.27632 Transcript_12664/m.27632 type:complete len:91 (+) Transcript_12664:1354-1626(+)